ncbi:methyl-accepting chemotaxis protein [Arcobacter arenosus]|jgi:methyl-accepting chemotaxis protein|uniref:methyl-accepting chemotaxis protein n=1 Tax=Arcobacter arenosus TaxID=2576037 RepID=UPI003BAD02A3
MNKNSIKFKLLSLVLVSIFFSFAILGFFNAQGNYNSQDINLKRNSVELAIQTSKFINEYLESKVKILETISKNMPKDENFNYGNKTIEKYLKIGSDSGGFEQLYIGVEKNGNFLNSLGEQRTPETTKYDARKRGWYIQAVKEGKGGVTPPYIDFSTSKLVVSVFAPVLLDGKTIGVVGSDIFIDTIVDTILKVKLDGGDLIAYLVDENNKIIIHKDKKLLDKKDLFLEQINTKEKNSFAEVNYNNDEKLIAYSTIDTTKWKIVLNLDKSSYYEAINNSVVEEVVLYLVLLVVILAIIFFSLLKILAPLVKLQDGFKYFFRYLKGDENDIKKIDVKSKCEFGFMAEKINIEMESISEGINQDRELIDNVKDVVSHIKSGKLDIKVEKSTSNKSLNELKDILNDMIETINENVNSDINPILSHLEEYSNLDFRNTIPNANGNVSKGLNNLCEIINKMLQENKNNGELLGENAKTLLQNVDILNKSSNETAVSLEETAAALEEITSTVSSNTNRITEMGVHSNELSVSIKKGQELANFTVTSMDEINEQTQAIAEAITVIDQIAFQTNILSLNAAVEAATAGEAGKGFAVVAQEVRNLAARSAEAAKEIKELVESATQKTNNGKQIADEMIKGYSQLNENILKTTKAITDISDSSKEQKISIEQINDVVNKLDQQTQNNASVANQTHSVAIQTSNIAQEILDAVNEKKFKDK